MLGCYQGKARQVPCEEQAQPDLGFGSLGQRGMQFHGNMTAPDRQREFLIHSRRLGRASVAHSVVRPSGREEEQHPIWMSN